MSCGARVVQKKVRALRLFAGICLFLPASAAILFAICRAWWSHGWLSRSRVLLWLHEAKDNLSELKSSSVAGFSEICDLQAKLGEGHGEVTAAIKISSASLAVSLALKTIF